MNDRILSLFIFYLQIQDNTRRFNFVNDWNITEIVNNVRVFQGLFKDEFIPEVLVCYLFCSV